MSQDPKAAARKALTDFRSTFPTPTAENRAHDAKLEAELTALREADGSLFDDQAAERERWAVKNEAQAAAYPRDAEDCLRAARLFRAEAFELRRKAIVVRAATFSAAA